MAVRFSFRITGFPWTGSTRRADRLPVIFPVPTPTTRNNRRPPPTKSFSLFSRFRSIRFGANESQSAIIITTHDAVTAHAVTVEVTSSRRVVVRFSRVYRDGKGTTASSVCVLFVQPRPRNVLVIDAVLSIYPSRRVGGGIGNYYDNRT